jgi:hypothetical protein
MKVIKKQEEAKSYIYERSPKKVSPEPRIEISPPHKSILMDDY